MLTYVHTFQVLTSVKNKVSGVIIYIISRHQSGDDKDVAVVTELTSTMLAAVLAELQNASRQVHAALV